MTGNTGNPKNKSEYSKYKEYKKYIGKKRITLVLLGVILLGVVLLSLSVGSSGLPLSEILRVLLGEAYLRIIYRVAF